MSYFLSENQSLTSKSLPDIRQIAEEILPKTYMNEIDRKLSETILFPQRRLKDLITKVEFLWFFLKLNG